MKKLFLLAVLFLSACQSDVLQSPSETPDANNQVRVVTSVAEESLISSTGIGKAKLGMTVRELKSIVDSDTRFEVVSPFLVDVNAISVSQEGIIQYYILYPAGTTSHPDGVTPTDDDKISFLVTDNSDYKTQEGVRAGMLIEDAEEICGDAILSYNTEGESREYITFNGSKSDNIGFRASYFKLISDGLGFSGIYSEYPGVSYTTDKYRDDAAIASVEVSCDPDNCLN